ncbi:TetR/AcrR family transcriptional regulator [Parvularcula flava]|uniref:TetR family transcriptional regulator n=1 Tax=Aquisalinus luteolus TaxID=1566827 RepID=A0A8J3A1Q4_9PROT|nr:TetR/AcrR family transcriptional regulator [Aquisalinus luteolus]NHK26835.1 TetR/AcrR family transcriptional regulator [Aquisalinus luteolus]GGH93556.1 TetR family transcriptional regulator [Aquisalinus luteolus]
MTDDQAAEAEPVTKKDQALQAAARCFVEEGFHGSSMSRIAKAAKMSVGHIYHYFASKDEIIAAIVREEEIKADEKLAYFRSLPAEALHEALITKIDEAACHLSDMFHSVLMLEILAEAARNPEIARIVQELDTSMRNGFIEIIGQRMGLSNAEARVEVLFSVIGGLAIRAIRNPDFDRRSVVPVIEGVIGQILSEH